MEEYNLWELMSESKVGDIWICKDTGAKVKHTEEGFFWLEEDGNLSAPIVLNSETLAITWIKYKYVYKVGDWIFNTTLDPDGPVIYQVTEEDVNFINEGVTKGIRLATKEEIEQELVRRKWQSANRVIGVYKVGDIITVNGEVCYVFTVSDEDKPTEKSADETSSSGSIEDTDVVKLVCTVEQRL